MKTILKKAAVPAIAVVVGVLLWCLFTRSYVQRLPKTGTIELFDETFRTNHLVQWGSPWRSKARNVLPSQIARWINPSEVVVASDSSGYLPTDMFVVWFKVEPRRYSLPRLECFLLDANGTTLDTSLLWEPMWHPSPQGFFYAGFATRPSNAAMVRLSFLEEGHQPSAAEFTNWSVNFPLLRR